MSVPTAAGAIRATSDMDMFDPPNSLKMKAKDKMAADVIAKKLDEELKVARDKLHGRKAAPRFLPDLHPVAADAGTAGRRAAIRSGYAQAGQSGQIDRPAAGRRRAREGAGMVRRHHGRRRRAATGRWTATPRCIFWASARSACINISAPRNRPPISSPRSTPRWRSSARGPRPQPLWPASRLPNLKAFPPGSRARLPIWPALF